MMGHIQEVSRKEDGGKGIDVVGYGDVSERRDACVYILMLLTFIGLYEIVDTGKDFVNGLKVG